MDQQEARSILKRLQGIVCNVADADALEAARRVRDEADAILQQHAARKAPESPDRMRRGGRNRSAE